MLGIDSVFPTLRNMRDLFLVFLAISLLSGCGQLMSNAKQAFAKDLSDTIVQYDDPETIKKAVPSYLVLVSSMIRGEPDNADLLESGAKLYGAYASAFADSEASQKALSQRAFSYASRSFCIRQSIACGLNKQTYPEFLETIKQFDQSQAEHLFVYSSTWAGVIQANSGDWNKVAELPKVKAAITRVIELDDTVADGNAYLYLAVMETLLPPALGGKPELAKAHFESALRVSDGRNLMAKVLYAEKYARLLFDQELHDRLLKEVINLPLAENDENRLVNVLAKQKAKELLLSAEDYF